MDIPLKQNNTIYALFWVDDHVSAAIFEPTFFDLIEEHKNGSLEVHENKTKYMNVKEYNLIKGAKM